MSPAVIDELTARVESDPMMTFYAVNKKGSLRSNASENPNAITWGAFPGKEIVQPTIVERISFLAWKDEAFRLGSDWARCYDVGSESRHLIDGVMENWYLVNIGKLPVCKACKHVLTATVDNDFRRSDAIFRLFDGMTVPGSDNGTNSTSNGTNGANGHA